MFYSHQILQKRGPLGTVWIAAHMDRKLRKNQIAETCIGDSVGAYPKNPDAKNAPPPSRDRVADARACGTRHGMDVLPIHPLWRAWSGREATALGSV
jgi:hypothetical protein